MLHREPLLVTLLKLVDEIPWSQESAQRRRGRPNVYSERLIVKALVIMIIRRLYTAYSLPGYFAAKTPILTLPTFGSCSPKQGSFPRDGHGTPVSKLPGSIARVSRMLGSSSCDAAATMWASGGRGGCTG